MLTGKYSYHPSPKISLLQMETNTGSCCKHAIQLEVEDQEPLSDREVS